MADTIDTLAIRLSQLTSCRPHNPLYNLYQKCSDARSDSTFQGSNIACSPIPFIHPCRQSSKEVFYGSALWHIRRVHAFRLVRNIVHL